MVTLVSPPLPPTPSKYLFIFHFFLLPDLCLPYVSVAKASLSHFLSGLSTWEITLTPFPTLGCHAGQSKVATNLFSSQLAD
jgi:hypothetical protein